MDKCSVRLTVFFEDPFWVGIYERLSEGQLSVCKVMYGAEPKDYEVWESILKHYDALTFSPAVEIEIRQMADHPKRRQRNARKQARTTGVGTKSQQALQMQREEMKMAHKQASHELRDAEKRRQFALKQQKRKEKHRGH